MTVTLVPKYTATFIIQSSDIVGNTVPTIATVGALVYATDTQRWYQVLKDLTLANYIGPGSTVTISSGSLVVGSGSVVVTNTVDVTGERIFTSSASFVRPSDTTAYIPLDVVSTGSVTGTLITFPNIVQLGTTCGYITKGRLLTSASPTAAGFRLHLYNTSPCAIADNAPFTLLWANRTNRIGYIDFETTFSEGTGSDSAVSLSSFGDGKIPMSFCTSGSTSASLVGILETKAAFTPVSGQQFFIELETAQY